MPRRRSGGAIDDQIKGLALRFAGEITRVVRGGIASEVSTQVAKVIEGITRGTGASARLPAAFSGDRRLGKAPVPVTCPAPGCKNTGIRAKRNFCADHAASLSDSEKAKYREAQL